MGVQEVLERKECKYRGSARNLGEQSKLECKEPGSAINVGALGAQNLHGIL